MYDDLWVASSPFALLYLHFHEHGRRTIRDFKELCPEINVRARRCIGSPQVRGRAKRTVVAPCAGSRIET